MEAINQYGVMYSDQQPTENIRWGLGGLLFLTDCIMQLQARKIDLNDLIEIQENIQKENLTCVIKFYEGEFYTVSHLLKLYIVTQSPQIPLILSPYLNEKTNKKSLVRVHELAKRLKIDTAKIINITGRPHRHHEQGFTTEDFVKIIMKWSKISIIGLKLLKTFHVEHRHVNYEVSTRLFDDGVITHGFFWSELKVSLVLNQKESRYAVVHNYFDILTQDILAEYTIQNETPMELSPQCIELGEYKQINLAGDFYLGEWYSRRRNHRKIMDYYSYKGAAYCYEKVKKLFPPEDLNIVNSEASVVDFEQIVSPYIEYKKFILDANPHKLFPAFRDLNVKAVVLANNHSYDFGSQGLTQTVRYFKHNEIAQIGIGETLQNSLNYYKVKTGKTNLYIFSAYWFRANQYFEYDCYAKNQKSGVGSINPFLFETIKSIKKQDDKAFVLVSPHWGVDFKPTSGVQRSLARHLIEAGADLIIGHGSHSLQSIEQIKGKYVIYSLGNFVFNSDGEFDTHNAPKFGLFARLNFEDIPKLSIFALDADNHGTKFQPCTVASEKFKNIIEFYKKPIHDGILKTDLHANCLSISLIGE